MSTDRLIEIPQSQWSDLRDLYLNNWPLNMIGYYTIDNYIQWFEKLSSIEQFSIYSLNGDWLDGTFAIIDRNHLFTNSLNESNEKLTTLLLLLDWTSISLVSTLRKKHRSSVLEVIQSKNLKKLADTETVLYYMSKEECRHLEVSIPNGITIGKLTAEQVKIANSVWPNADPTSLSYLQRISELNPNVGVTTNNNKLISWSFRLPSGPLNALQVDEEYKRMGFGSLTLKLMATELSQLGHDTAGCVAHDNTASHAMFKRIGFKVIDNIFFIIIENSVLFEIDS